MLFSLFRLSNKSKRLIELFETKFLLEDYKKLDKKISKLNEFQFFQLCLNAFYNLPVCEWELERLELLFKKISYQTNSNPDYIPYIDDSKQEANQIITEDYIKLNCSNKLNDFVEYVLNTNEYNVSAHKQKLSALSDKVIEDLIPIVTTIDHYFSYYLEETDFNPENTPAKKNYFCLMITAALENFEDQLNFILDKISLKIKNISKKSELSFVNSYDIKLEDGIINELYKELRRYDFIFIEETSKEDFLKVLKSDWNSHSSVVHFKMNNLEFSHFIDVFCQTFNTKIPFTKIEFAENIKNKNGYIKSSSIYASKSQSKYPSESLDIIENIVISTKKIKTP